MAVGILASPTRALRMGYDYARGGVNIEDPALLAVCPTLADPGRAPPGKHTVKIIGFQPYDLPEGPQHWDDIKEEVSPANSPTCAATPPTSPTTRSSPARRKPARPRAHEPHNWHGSCHGGAQNAAQSGNLRPVPGFATHRMPIPGLYQTGSTTHPRRLDLGRPRTQRRRRPAEGFRHQPGRRGRATGRGARLVAAAPA